MDALPHHQETEEALLGAILINPEIYPDVASFIQADDFYFHHHGFLWEAIKRLNQNKLPVDILTLVHELDQVGQLKEIGGPAYLTALTNAAPSSLHANAYGQKVSEMAVRRRMIQAANKIAKAAYKTDHPLDDVLNQAERAVFDVVRRSADRDLTPAAEVASQVYDEVAGQKDQSLGVPTGFIDLDHLLGMLRKSDFIVLAGRPGTGKTSLLLSILRHATVDLGKSTALFSLEMDNGSMGQRLLSQISGIPLQRIRDRKLLGDDWEAFTKANEILCASPLIFDDSPLLTPMRLRTQCRRLAMQKGLDLVIVDYLQLMSGGDRFSNRTQEVSSVSRQLKILAREMQVPILVSAQLSRAVELRQDKRPTLADLRESGAIEQDADIVMFLYRNQAKGVTKLAIEKHRNGPTGIVDLAFRSSHTKFENVIHENSK